MTNNPTLRQILEELQTDTEASRYGVESGYKTIAEHTEKLERYQNEALQAIITYFEGLAPDTMTHSIFCSVEAKGFEPENCDCGAYLHNRAIKEYLTHIRKAD